MRIVIIILLFCCACSPKGFDFKASDKQGVRFKKSIEPRAIRLITIGIFITMTPLVLITDE